MIYICTAVKQPSHIQASALGCIKTPYHLSESPRLPALLYNPNQGPCSSAPYTFSDMSLSFLSLSASRVILSGLGGPQPRLCAATGSSRSLGEEGSEALRPLPGTSEFERSLCSPLILRLNMGRSVGRQALTIAIPSSTIVQITVGASDPCDISFMCLGGEYFQNTDSLYRIRRGYG